MVQEDLELLPGGSFRKGNTFTSFLAWSPKPHDQIFNPNCQSCFPTVGKIRDQKKEYFLALLDLWITYVKDPTLRWVCKSLLFIWHKNTNISASGRLSIIPVDTWWSRWRTSRSEMNSMPTTGQAILMTLKEDVPVIPVTHNHTKQLKKKNTNVKKQQHRKEEDDRAAIADKRQEQKKRRREKHKTKSYDAWWRDGAQFPYLSTIDEQKKRDWYWHVNKMGKIMK